MADITKTVAVIFKGTDQISPNIEPINDAIGGMGDEAGEASENIENTGKQLDILAKKDAAVDRVTVALKALAAALIADRFIEINVAAERFQKTMEFATGSTTAASQEWEYAVGVADKFGIQLETVTSAYSKFVAGTKGSELSAAELRTTFEGVTGTLSLVGGSAQDVEEALRQMTQGIGKNRFELEDLKSIAERIPGGMYAIADALDITTEELYKMITAGQFGGEEIAKVGQALQDNLNGVSFDSFEQSLARLKNTIDLALIDLGQTGVFDSINKALQGITLSIVGAIEGFSLLGNIIGIQLGAIADGDWFGESENFKTSWDEAFQDFYDGVETARDRFLDFGNDVETKLFDISKIDPQLDKLFDAEALGVTVDSLDDIDAAIENVLDNKTIEGDLFGELSDSAVKAQAEIEKTAVQLEKIKTDLEIAKIEASVSLDIANVEANAEVAVAIIEGISSSVAETSQLIGSLFGALNDADSISKRFLIEDQIEEQAKLQKELIETQIRQSEEQILTMRAQRRRLAQGGALITVNGDGLQPHLEAIMFELLESIQVRLNSEGYSQLLGV